MKVCIVGSGAVGGTIGAHLDRVGAEITLIDKGEQLATIQENGLKLIDLEGTTRVLTPFLATDDFGLPGPQDIVILAVKAHDIAKVANGVRALCHFDTVVIPTQNGLPWWYFQRHGGPHEGRTIEALDPDGLIGKAIEPERIIGCVVYFASEVSAPGVVRQVEGNRISVGELDGTKTDRAESLSVLFKESDFKSYVLEDVRSEIWLKLLGATSFNPISALTHATMVDICQFAPSRDLVFEMMSEAQNIANKLGITIRVSLEQRIAGAERVGKHKTSTLQDVEAGRRLEAEALVGAVIEVGRLTKVPTPRHETIYACVKLLDRLMAGERVGVRAFPLGQ